MARKKTTKTPRFTSAQMHAAINKIRDDLAREVARHDEIEKKVRELEARGIVRRATPPSLQVVVPMTEAQTAAGQ